MIVKEETGEIFMKTFTLIALIASIAAISSNSYADEQTPVAELVELGLHKIERLSSGTSPKIEASFQGQTLEILVGESVNGVREISYLQGMATDGSRKTALIKVTASGNIAGYSVNQASVPANPMAISPLTAITFLENSFHCLQGEPVASSNVCKNTTALKVFSENVSRVVLTPNLSNDLMTTGATIEIFGTGLAQKAVITFNPDGSLSAESPIQFIQL
jgi:hypothetical protein